LTDRLRSPINANPSAILREDTVRRPGWNPAPPSEKGKAGQDSPGDNPTKKIK
jgi:hypothetical protein